MQLSLSRFLKHKELKEQSRFWGWKVHQQKSNMYIITFEINLQSFDVIENDGKGFCDSLEWLC